MLEYADFYDIAEYGNENWKGSFTLREIACNAYDYKVEYDYSIKQGKFCVKKQDRKGLQGRKEKKRKGKDFSIS